MSQINQTHSTTVILLMVMSISTATVDRNAASQELSALYKTTERMSGLILMHVHKDTELDVECIIHQVTHQKKTGA